MAMDQSLKRKGGRPAGSQSAKSKMLQKVALVKQRLALLDSSSSSSSESDYTPTNEERGDLLALQVASDEEMYLEMETQISGAHDVSADISNRAEVSGVSRQNIGASNGSAMVVAKEVQAKLPIQHPSFTKRMLKSHVIRGFWLGLPTKFCGKHLPTSDTIVVLEDENGEKHDANYLAAKKGLSAGWRGFAMKHSLQVGDVVVFELVAFGSKIEPPRFKVYIARANELTAGDDVGNLLNSEVWKEGKLLQEESAGEEDPEVNTIPPGEEEEVLLIDCKGIVTKAPDGTRIVDPDANDVVSEAIDGIRLLDSDIEFEDVTSFNNFNIVVDRLVIDCKFQDHLRRTYYELCCSQKAFLHKHLLKHLNLSLVVGMIMETINIAEGIRACKGEAEDFVIWKKTLESFELLGMNVAFLLKRVDALLGLQTQSINLSELRLQSARAAENVKAMEVQLSGVKDVLRSLDVNMQEMESSLKKTSVALQKLANCTPPW